MCWRHTVVGSYICVYLYMYLYLYVWKTDFSKVGKNEAPASEVCTSTAEQYLKLNSLRCLNKGFVHY